MDAAGGGLVPGHLEPGCGDGVESPHGDAPSRRPLLPALAIGAALAVLSCGRPSGTPAAPPLPPGPGEGVSGLVASAHPLATDAGLEILRAGGNAFDAAVAVAAALNVVEPPMSGLGGYGTILVYDAARSRVRYLNPSGRIPFGVDPGAFRPPTPGYLENRRGAKAVSTPGNLHAWEAMSEEYGALAWARLFEPAIRLAERGFPLDDDAAALLARAYASFPPHAQAIFGRGGRPLAAGETLVQRDLASSCRKIAARGAGVLYGGEIGQAIDRAMRESDGFLRRRDLLADRAEWWAPIHIAYRGYEVYTAAPPANAFDYLVRLGVMSRFDAVALGHNGAAYLHRFAEATKLGFWVRLRYAGDPGVRPPPLDRLLWPASWQGRRPVDPDHASAFAPPPFTGGGDHTTHFVVADRWGNIVSATQTLGNAYGSRIMPEGTGIWLNNSLQVLDLRAGGQPDGRASGPPQAVRRLPDDHHEGRAAVGGARHAGRAPIGQTVPQMVMNLIDFRMDIAAAIAAPRVSSSSPTCSRSRRVSGGRARGARRAGAPRGNHARARQRARADDRLRQGRPPGAVPRRGGPARARRREGLLDRAVAPTGRSPRSLS